MKCAKCGYSLWNLPQPRCPECGQSFNVADWTFKSGTVRFHCNACDHPLMHRQPGYSPARCNNCNEIIAWSDVRVVPVNERAEESTTRGLQLAGVPLAWQIALFVVALLLWVLFAAPALGGRPSPPSLVAHIAIVAVFAVPALVALCFAPRDKRRNTGVIWLCILVLATGLAISNYRGAKAKREQFVAWRTAQSEILQLKHSIGMFITDSPESDSWGQFTDWLADTVPLINDLEGLPGHDDWMRSGKMYVDTRSLFLRLQENSPAERWSSRSQR